MGTRKSNIEHFSYYPLIAVRNSFITIQWSVKGAFFVYISNGVGFGRAKGVKLVTLNRSGVYKIIAFGWFGRETKELEPLILKVETNVPSAKLIAKKPETTNFPSVNSLKIKGIKAFRQINKLKIKYKPLGIKPDIEPLKADLLKIQQCESTGELEALIASETTFQNKDKNKNSKVNQDLKINKDSHHV